MTKFITLEFNDIETDGLPYIDGEKVTSVLFVWDGGVYTGWPLEDGEDIAWETSEFAHCLYGVKYWAYWPEDTFY